MPILDLIPTAEVAARLKTSPRQVARLVEQGRATPVTKTPGIRGAFMFAESEVQRLLAEQKKEDAA